MKKILILLLAIFTCFNTEATIHMAHSTLPAKVAAASAARRQRERLAEKQQHEEEFHHGDLDCEVELIEQEIKERQKTIDFVFTLVGATLVTTIISIILIVLSGKKKLSIGYKEI